MKNKFKLSRVAASVAVVITGIAASQGAFAGAGFTDVTAANGLPMRKATFFAYSPSGPRVTPIPEGKLVGSALDGDVNTGVALRKFVDPLPIPGVPGTLADGTTKYIPVAQASKWTNPQGNLTTHDYYEIGIVEYSDKFHSDLKKATTLRGYVQIDHLATNGLGLLPGSKAVPLFYPDTKDAMGLTIPGAPILIAKTDASGKLIPGAAKVQALAVEAPHFLGPVIAANKDTPTRMKVLNLLPVGRGEAVLGTKNEINPKTGGVTSVPTWNVTNRHGDLFLPVDKSIPGAGIGPDGLTEFTQNRASVHLHGGDTPWISDGTPHQWITPAGENDVNEPLSLANLFNNDPAHDPSLLSNYIKGASTQNVPDMNDPGDGAMTLYFPNGHTARMEWYHDHTLGSTRLNVYAGMASAYLVTDTVEAGLVSSGALPPASRTIPLVLQDRTFVPDDIALQDAHWNTTAWGQPGDSWFPHVYETVQDPNQANNWNSVGRWHYGPWFWPVFPALYNLPEGTYSPAGQENTVTTTPEGWNDTAIVNGVAYPTLTVDPTTYRFRVLNASNDRMMTFNLFEATATGTLSDGTPSPNVDNKDANGNPLKTELNMVPAAAPLAADACLPGVRRPVALSGGKFCTPETWPTDGRIGGVPNPAGVGPTIYQIANESGWLPAVATYEPTPINYIQDKGRIVVLNVDLGNSGLLIAPAERADVVIDFSQYAGKTLLVYNDSGAPVPAGDPRNDLFTGVGDQTGEGGAEDTKPGFGPNTRTMMQIVVKAANAGAAAVAADPTAVPPVLGSPAIPAVVPTAPIDPTVLNTAIRTAYFSDQTRRPVVAQDVYSGFDASWAGMAPKDMYGDIYLGSLKNPTFQFTPGTPSTGLASISMTNMGAGYTVAPEVSIAKPAGGVAATGLATMKIDKIAVTNKGKGYTSAPVMSFSQGGGNGALANAFLAVDPTSVTFTPGKYGTFTGSLQVTFTAAPGATVNAPAGVTATGTATVVNGAVTGIVITNPGSGYTSIPLVNIVAKDLAGNAVASTVKATAKVTGVVDSIILYGTDNTTPTMSALTSGGGGYTDLTPGTFNVNIRGGLPLDPATGLALAPAVNAVGVATGKVFDITLTNPGSGYAAGATPVVTLTQKIGGVITVPTTKAVAAAKAAATPGAKASYLVKTKTIQELFDPTYGRLNATLGIELPFTSAMTQTTIPLGYVDETTEQFAEGETQIWKITHNGVDSHPVHFHLLDVQVINRVGWDGFIQPIEPKEMGWKETVMMSPLEDIIVAVRAKKPVLPGFGVPESNRLMDPTQPEGSPFGFTQIDPATGNPAIVTNAWKNYGWEYVWHCHILGHEENDFMRPVRFDAKEIMPPSFAPTVTASVTDTTATINFVDNSTSEIKYSVRRAPVNLAGNVVLPYVEIGTELALTAPTLGSSYVDTGLSLNSMYSYQVAAIGGFIDPATATNAEAASTVKVSTYVVPTAATNVTATPDSATQVTLNWTAGAPVTSYSIVRTASVGGAKKTFTAVAGAVSLVDNTAAGGTAYSYVVTAVNGDKTTASSPATVTTPAIPLVAPSNLTAGVSSTTNRGVTTYSIRLNWTDNTSTETGFAIWRQTDGATAVQIGTVLANVATFNNSATNSVLSGHTYAYYVTAINTTPVQVSPVSNTVAVKVAVPVAPTGLTATPGANRSGRVVLNWTAPVDGAVTSSQIQYATNSGFTGSRNVAVNGGGTAGTVTGLTRGTTYYFRVVATNGLGAGAASAVVTAVAP